MTEQIIPRKDVEFVLYEQLGVDQLFESENMKDVSRSLCDITLAEARKTALNEFLPTFVPGDREGVRYEDGRVSVPACFHQPYSIYADGGWIAMTESAEFGGQGMPHVIAQAADEYFRGANAALLMYGAMCHGVGKMIELFGTPMQRSLYVEKLYAGAWGGTMLLTEPDAGSDVGNLSTTARKNEDGTWSLRGNKIFITNGEQDLTGNIIHTVLARTEGAPASTGGISIFIVPKYILDPEGNPSRRNDIRCAGVEEKMGLHGSATCSMVLGEKSGCIGYLLGEENKGLQVMFYMMNEARLMMGASGGSAASAAYLTALAYAGERKQGRALNRLHDPEAPQVPIIQHPDVQRMLYEMKAFSEGMRSFIYYVAYLFDLAACAEDDNEKTQWEDLIALLTPIVKSYCSDKGFWVCNQAMMVFGGAGYTKEYPVEQWLRDIKVAAIVEGTNGIQAMDLLGRKMAMKKGRAFGFLLSEIQKTIDEAKTTDSLSSLSEELERAVSTLGETSFELIARAGSGRIFETFFFAHPFLDVMGDVIMGWMLLWRASAARKAAAGAKGRSLSFYRDQIKSASLFIRTRLPVTLGRMSAIKNGGSDGLFGAEV